MSKYVNYLKEHYCESVFRFALVANELRKIKLELGQHTDLNIPIHFPDYKMEKIEPWLGNRFWTITRLEKASERNYFITAEYEDGEISIGTNWADMAIGDPVSDENVAIEIMFILNYFENVFIRDVVGTDPRKLEVDYATNIVENMYDRLYDDQEPFDGQALGELVDQYGNVILVEGVKYKDDLYFKGTNILWKDEEHRWKNRTRYSHSLPTTLYWDSLVNDVLQLLDNPADEFMTLNFWDNLEEINVNRLVDKLLQEDEKGKRSLILDIEKSVPDYADYTDMYPDEWNLCYKNLIEENLKEIKRVTGFTELTVELADPERYTYEVKWTKEAKQD